MTGIQLHIMQTPLDQRQTELMAMPSIMSFFPLMMPSKRQWLQFEGKCQGCKKVVSPEDLRGQVSWPIPTTAVVEAVGVCHGCRLVTPFFYRLHDDAHFSAPTPNGWQKWAVQAPSSPHIAMRFFTCMRKVFRFS